MIRFDFRFSAQDSYAALPWIIAFMVFLTLLCSSIALNVRAITANWQARYDYQLTVQLPAGDLARQRDRDVLLAGFSDAPGVSHVTALSNDAVRMLLAPWLGEGVKLESLPVPMLLDVELKPFASAKEDFQRWLAERHPNARVDDQALWLNDFNRLVRSTGWLAAGVVMLVVAVTLVILVMSTRTELAMHRGTLMLLRDLGAHDDYIARQFQTKAMSMSIKGTAAGMAAALVTLLIFARISQSIEAPFLPLMRLGWGHAGLFALIGAGMVALAVLAARVTTLRELHQRLWQAQA